MDAAAALLDGVTPEQHDAIVHVSGPLLVLAGAGSGKTLVITRRLAYLVAQGIPPESILAVTFTNKASREMKDRILRHVHADRLWVSTFHSFAARMLRREIEALDYPRSFTIYDEADRAALVSAVMKELHVDTDFIQPAAVAAAISRAKNDLVSPRTFEQQAGGLFAEQVARVYVRYEHSMKSSGALDFDDLLLKARELLREHAGVRDRWCRRFQYLLVDEYQDTNAIQYDLVKLLGREHGNVCVTGDPDQAIYTWRGADIRNILSFERDFPEARVIKLEKNFRSHGNILKAADGVIVHNSQRKPKSLYTDAPDGEKLLAFSVLDEVDEARTAVRLVREHLDRGGRRSEIAVFYRTNALSRSLERAFLEAGIPYDVVGTVAFYERREIKDLLAYLRVVANPADDLSFLRMLNTPPRGIGTRTIQHLRAYAETTGLRLREVVRDIAAVPGIRPRPRKALESFRVFLEDLEARRDSPLGDYLERLIGDLGFVGYLEQQGDPRSGERVENVHELVASAREFERTAGDAANLIAYLEDVALVSQADLYGGEEDRVSLMTIHNAKGLEFDQVVLAAFEEGLLPHGRSIEAGESALEEERRLCYVAITRARKRFALTYAQTRTVGGMLGSPRSPSRFLAEIPPKVLEHRSTWAERGPPEYGAPAVPDWPADPARERESRPAPESPAMELTAGQLVRHALFGVGRVIRLEGRGPGRKARIRFTTAGERLLVVEYAGLTPVD
jgi:DNA helicase-2/ATP-dependent DNA helicase PcrA